MEDGLLEELVPFAELAKWCLRLSLSRGRIPLRNSRVKKLSQEVKP